MRILFTNHALDLRAGTELYVRDVVLELLRRGHEPLVYSRRLGAVAEELRAATVPVFDDLEKLRRPPDLVHGQHHLETLTALCRFPRTPALYLCHGWLPDEEAPPRHPRIRRYLAIDALVRQRLVDECGIDPASIEDHRNFVDLDRFRARGPLPAQPRRALVLSNQASESNYLPVLRRACEAAGLELDAVGIGVGRTSAAPGELLGDYDLVFAKGRAALEAATVGAAVILCDRSGLGPLVTAEALDELRDYNFGVRLLRSPITVEGVTAELGRYDAADAMEVARRLRERVGLDRAVDRLLRTYEGVISDFAEEPSSEPQVAADAESLALARYLRWGPLRAGDLFQAERDRLKEELVRASTWAQDLGRQVEELAANGARTAEEKARVHELLTECGVEQERLRAEANAAEGNLAGHQARIRQLEGVVKARERDLDRALDQAQRAEERLAAFQAGGPAFEAERERLLRAERRASELDEELRSIHASASWRWRQRLLSQRWLVAIYRGLRGRGRS